MPRLPMIAALALCLGAVSLGAASCAPVEAPVTDRVTPGVCHLTVTFASYGTGADSALRDRITALIQADRGVLDVQESRWGREGESTLCVSTQSETVTDRLYDAIAAAIPDRSNRGPTTVEHIDGRRRASAIPVGGS